ncbi:DUF4906 domain-containing protein [Bacteroides helcogenes]|nr:DUF4906 domain-containing protein [Bacteroides helcogenes]
MLLSASASLISCMQEYDVPEEPYEEKPAILRLHVENRNQTDAATRTMNENVINDLHILIYNSNGELIGQKYTTGSTATVNTRSTTGCTIYAIANTGNSDLFNHYDIHSENYLKKLTRSISSWNELTEGNTLPMTGSKTNVTIAAGTSTLSGGLTVTRMTAKVTLNVTVAPGFGITIDNYRIYGIPRKAYYVLRPLDTETSTSDTQTSRAGDAVRPAIPVDWTNSGVLTPSSATNTRITFHMFENRPGINSSITDQKDKGKAKVPGIPADSAAYVVINGKALGYKKLSWKIYLGATNTANFNIKRNCAYTYNIVLKPTTTDTRVIYEKSGTVWAGSNIYWDGSKLTFDETVSGNSDLKQGVFFKWGSLIGIITTGDISCFIPTYNATSPTSSTWTLKTYNYDNIYCFKDENLASTNDRGNTYLNDNARNTDAFYQAYKGDICKYLSKTGAVAGNWRMPTSKEFGEGNQYTHSGNFNNAPPTNNEGTALITSSYWTYISDGSIVRFPASGYRGIYSGNLKLPGPEGFYWSSSTGIINAWRMDFLQPSIGGVFARCYYRHDAFVVRCVWDY